jgi:predicted O-methyltransferase YrrM
MVINMHNLKNLKIVLFFTQFFFKIIFFSCHFITFSTSIEFFNIKTSAILLDFRTLASKMKASAQCGNKILQALACIILIALFFNASFTTNQRSAILTSANENLVGVKQIESKDERPTLKSKGELIALIRKVIEEDKKQADVDNLTSREELPILLNRFGYKTMIEIGVYKGRFADLLLSKWKDFEHYWGVDVWQEQKNYVDGTNAKADEQENNYNMTYTTLTGNYGKERITLVRNYSTLALPLFKKESIDFIYIDARHDYCGCTEDMTNYYPILKCGGLFAGHDFQFESKRANNDWGVCANGTRVEGAVKKAVLEFAKLKGIERVFSTGELFFPSWYFFKRCNELLSS